jgi:serine protease inhibitor
MIANAMYFKGKWRNAFDFDKTSVKCFYVEVNQCLDTYFMETVKVYNYAYISSLHAHAVELPYEVSILNIILEDTQSVTRQVLSQR